MAVNTEFMINPTNEIDSAEQKSRIQIHLGRVKGLERKKVLKYTPLLEPQAQIRPRSGEIDTLRVVRSHSILVVA